MKDRFCSNCGVRHIDKEYPKHCRNCDTIAWDNPIPVVVCVQPIGATRSLAVAKRAIEPRKDTWNFIGGHIEQGEDAITAAIREWREETSIEPGENPRVTGTYANGHGHILIAVEFDLIYPAQWAQAKLCPENSEFDTIRVRDSRTLGFPIHQKIFVEWLDKLRNYG